MILIHFDFPLITPFECKFSPLWTPDLFFFLQVGGSNFLFYLYYIVDSQKDTPTEWWSNG